MAGNLTAADAPTDGDVIFYRDVLTTAPIPVERGFEQRVLLAPPLPGEGEAGVTVRWQQRLLAQADQPPGPKGPQGPGPGGRGPKGPPGRPGEEGDAFGGAIGGGGSGAFGEMERFFLSTAGGPGRMMPHSVLLPSGGLDAAALNEVDEDLPVMARILDRAIERDNNPANTAMGISVVSLGIRPGQNLFIEGFGVVFERSVGFPLTPTQKQEPKEPRKTDSEWERARNEIFGNREPGRNLGGQDPFAPAIPEYDAERVDRLKTQVLESLKNASNLRHLKASDTIAVIITGTDTRGMFTRSLRMPAPSRPTRTGAAGGGGSSVSADVTVQTQSVSGPGAEGPRGRPAQRPGSLTIRAKKSDVDAFATGKLTMDDFKKKAFIQVN